MLTPPDLSAGRIAAQVRGGWGHEAVAIAFLPLGADLDSAAYRIDTREAHYFLKLRRRQAQAAVAIPAFAQAVQGIAAVLAPLPTGDGRLRLRADGYDWALYPYVGGADGFARRLSAEQWQRLGTALAALHRMRLPAALAALVPHEDYGPAARDLLAVLRERAAAAEGDRLALALAALWRARRDDLDAIAGRAGMLAAALARDPLPCVPCHADLHAGNVIVADDGALHIVDWDTVMLAPKERDLMFIGGGIGGVWNPSHEAAAFYRGYGEAMVDPYALAYYRYERIVVDLVETGSQILDRVGSVEDREEGMRQLAIHFEDGHVLDIAHAGYARLGADGLKSR